MFFAKLPLVNIFHIGDILLILPILSSSNIISNEGYILLSKLEEAN